MTASLSLSSLIAFLVSFCFCVFLCALLLRPAERVMARRKITVVEYPSWRKRAEDVPPIGGLAMIAATAVGFLLSGLTKGGISGEYAFLTVVAVLFAAVGLTDDIMTVTQNRKFALPSYAAPILRSILAVGFAVYSYNYNGGGYIPLSVFSEGIDLGLLYIPIAALVILFFTFSSEITNGSDGLNSMCCVPVFAYFALFSLERQGTGDENGTFFSFALLGATLGFLIFGKPPARILEGKSGASFCGTSAVLLCFLLKRPAIIFVIGFVWLVQGLSFLLSRGVYILTLGKRRLLPIAPIDSFLRSVGVPETVVVFSYFAVGVIFAAVAYVLTGGL